MRINRSTSLMLSAAVALAVAAPAAANRPQDAKDTKRDTITSEEDCGEGNTLVALADLTMWPPNHKTQPVTFVATDADGGDVTLTSTATHDEYLSVFEPSEANQEEPEELNGSGNTINDASPFFSMDMETGDGENPTVSENSHDIRSERSGRGDGREYTLNADAAFDDGDCGLEIVVTVPHDMRGETGEANGKNGGASLNEDGSPKGNG